MTGSQRMKWPPGRSLHNGRLGTRGGHFMAPPTTASPYIGSRAIELQRGFVAHWPAPPFSQSRRASLATRAPQGSPSGFAHSWETIRSSAHARYGFLTFILDFVVFRGNFWLFWWIVRDTMISCGAQDILPHPHKIQVYLV